MITKEEAKKIDLAQEFVHNLPESEGKTNLIQVMEILMMETDDCYE